MKYNRKFWLDPAEWAGHIVYAVVVCVLVDFYAGAQIVASMLRWAVGWAWLIREADQFLTWDRYMDVFGWMEAIKPVDRLKDGVQFQLGAQLYIWVML